MKHFAFPGAPGRSGSLIHWGPFFWLTHSSWRMRLTIIAMKMIATVNYVLIIGMGAKAIFHIITFHTHAYLQVTTIILIFAKKKIKI